MTRAALILTFVLAALALPAAARAQNMDCKSFNSKSDPGESVDVSPGVTRRTFKNVTIYCDDQTIYADELVEQTDNDIATLTGNVEFEEAGFHIFADHAVVNKKTRLGTFYQAQGTAALPPKTNQDALFGGFEPDIIFWGDEISKVGDRKYRLLNGGFTSCVQPSPRWEFSTTAGTITLDKHVLLKNPVLRVKDVPVFYAPAIYYPINHEGRNTGFLMPQYGTSTLGGFTLSNAFFWAIGRSQDATFYHDYSAKTGQGFSSEYRYVQSPSSRGNLRFHVLNQKPLLDANGDSIGLPSKSYNVDGSMNQMLPHGFSLNARSNYSSSIQTNQLYQQDLNASTSRSSTIDAQLSGSFNRLRTTASFDLMDTYGVSNDITSARRSGYAPKVDLQLASHPIGHSKIYFGATGNVAYLLRQDQVGDPTTNHSLLRFDGSPTVSAPIGSLSFLNVQTSANWRLTEWAESLDSTGKQVTVPITRQLLTLSTDITGPGFERMFNTPKSHFAEKWKHQIQPRFSIGWVSNFTDSAKIVPIDGTDNIVGGTTTVRYGVTNTVLAKRRPSASLAAAAGSTMPASQAMTIVSVDINQSYYTDARASLVDAQYQSAGLAPPSKFSTIDVRANVTPTQRVSGNFETHIDPQFRTPRDYTASAGLNFAEVRVSAGWSRQMVIPDLPGYTADLARQSLYQSTTYTKTGGRVGVTYAFNYDIHNSLWLQQHIVAYYNSQCCGLSVNYSSSDISQYNLAAATNHQFAISFTLAGLGSFSNPFGSFGLR